MDEVQRLCDQNGVSTLNTRLTKTGDGQLSLLIASALNTLPTHFPKTLESKELGFVLTLQAGDHAASLKKVNAALREARKWTGGDENRKGMLSDYEKSFESGDVEMHKDGSRKWVKDVGPVVESYIGFIECVELSFLLLHFVFCFPSFLTRLTWILLRFVLSQRLRRPRWSSCRMGRFRRCRRQGEEQEVQHSC